MLTLIQEIHATHPIITLPFAVFAVLLAYIYHRRNKFNKHEISLEEFTNRLNKFNPEPLIPKSKVFIEPTIPKNNDVALEGPVFTEVQNLVASDYLNFIKNEEMKLIAANCIKTNGVGSCGPRGFYGTVDIHLDLEAKVADFMGLEETVLYSLAVSTMSSSIIAYIKREDVVFCDEKLCFTSLQGVQTTKCKTVYFKHNDVADLERLLKQWESTENSQKKARRFLLIEGIYHKTGTVCPLPELMEIRRKYMCRMFLDESISFGSIGKFGRGVTEYYNVDRTDIDLIVGSLELGIGSLGGFAVGSSFVIEHERLSGLGYCFSASLPPFLAAVAKFAIDTFETKPEMFEKLEQISRKTHEELELNKNLIVISDPISPKKVFKLVGTANVEGFLQNCKARGLLLDVDCDDGDVYFNIQLDMADEYISNICKIIAAAQG